MKLNKRPTIRPHHPHPSTPTYTSTTVTGTKPRPASGGPLKVDTVVSLPYTIANMHIKSSGARELVLRSLLSLKNSTSECMYVMIRLDEYYEDRALAPDEEWFVPMILAHPKASVYLRMKETLPWVEVLPSVQLLIVQGKWGQPYRLRADVCNCQPTNGSDSATNNATDDWLVLLKPEVRELRNGKATTSFLPVKYPTRDTAKASSGGTQGGGKELADLNATSIVDEIYNMDMFSTASDRNIAVQPMMIQLLPPLQLVNILCVPVLYRVCDQEGLICSEGSLLTGEIADLHKIPHLYNSRSYICLRYATLYTILIYTMLYVLYTILYILYHIYTIYAIYYTVYTLYYTCYTILYTVCSDSPHIYTQYTRLLNYSWSKWAKLLPGSNPFPASEKTVEVTLSSLTLNYQASELVLPTIDLQLMVREHVVRISCPTILSNRSGVSLDFCDSTNAEVFLPLTTKPSVELSMAVEAKSTNGRRKSKLGQSSMAITTPLGGPKRSLVIPSNSFDTDEENSDDDSSNKGDWDYSSSDYSPSNKSLFHESYDEQDSYTPNNNITSTRKDSYQAMKKLTTSIPHNSTAIEVTVYLPYNHFHSVTIPARSDWTLMDVFTALGNKVSTHKTNRSPSNYVFLPCDKGAVAPRRTKNIPTQDGNAFFTSSTTTTKTPKHSEVSLDREDTVGGVTETSLGPEKSPAKRSSFLGSLSSTTFTSLSNLANNLTSTDTAPKPSGQPTTTTSSTSTQSAIPYLLQYDMAAEGSTQNLTMDTKLASIDCLRLRLCHVNEWNIFRQVSSLQSEVVQKDGLLSQVFNRSKTKFLFPYMKFDGNIPFNPHRFLGFHPTLSLRVPNETTWSRPVDILSNKFGSGGDYVSAKGGVYRENVNKMLVEDVPLSDLPIQSDIQYDFGIYAEKGKGLFQGVTSISIVPKYILITKYPSALQIRQMSVQDEYTYIKLASDSIQSYHFGFQSKPKLLQIRRYKEDSSGGGGGGGGGAGKLSPVSVQSSSLDDWYGEIDLSSIGIIYAKLRNPLSILKIQIESVGASLAATITSQNNLWPPYRIDNKSTIEMRFRQQHVTKPINKKLPKQASKILSQKVPSSSSYTRKLSLDDTIWEDDSATVGTIDDDSPHEVKAKPRMRSSFSQGSISSARDLDQLDSEPTSSIPWDYLSGGQQVPYTWDYPKTCPHTLRIEFKQLSLLGENESEHTWVGDAVNLDNFQGTKTLILKRPIGLLTRTSAEGWLWKLDNKDSRWIRAFCVLQDDTIFVFKDDSRCDMIDIINLIERQFSSTDIKLKLASVSKYKEHSNTTAESLVLVDSSDTSRIPFKAKVLDVNVVRILQLKLAERIGLFGRPRDSRDSARQSLLSARGRVRGPMASDGASTARTPVPDISLASQLYKSSTIGKLSSKSTLKAHLETQLLVDDLLEKVSKVTFDVHELIEAFMGLGEVDSAYEAVVLVYLLYAQGALVSVYDSRSYDEEDDAPILPPPPPPPITPPSSPSAAVRFEIPKSASGSPVRPAPEARAESTSTPKRHPDHSVERVNFQQILHASGLGNLVVTDASRVDDNIFNAAINSSIAGLTSGIASAASLSAKLPNPFNSLSNSFSSPSVTSPRNLPQENTLASNDSTRSLAPTRIPTEFRFVIPMLHPEHSSDGTDARDASSFGDDLADIFGTSSNTQSFDGFTVTLGNTSSHFLCDADYELIHWIGNSRKSIEHTWVRFVRDEDIGLNQDMNEYKVEVSVTMQTDGPTAVLELTQVHHEKATYKSLVNAINAKNQVTTKLANESALARRSYLQRSSSGHNSSFVSNRVLLSRHVSATSERTLGEGSHHEQYVDDLHDSSDHSSDTADGAEEGVDVVGEDEGSDIGDEQSLDVFDETSAIYSLDLPDDTLMMDRLTSLIPTITLPPREYFFDSVASHNSANFDSDYQSLSLSLKVGSVGFSIIQHDPEPSELMYINFRDLDVHAERNLQRYTYASIVLVPTSVCANTCCVYIFLFVYMHTG